MNQRASSLSVGQCATLACLLEVAIPKPGNVHRGADFADTGLQDFLVSAVAIENSLQNAASQSLGETVYRSLKATRQLIDVNTNLGIILLLAPLATAKLLTREAVQECIDNATPDDCRQIYEAIRMASPGGLGTVPNLDVNDEPPDNLGQSMQVASDRDLIATQYVNGFREVFEFVAPGIQQGLANGWSLPDSVIHCHLRLMHEFPDSLICRKNGAEIANHSAALAGRVLHSGLPGQENYLQQLSDFDFWLRSDGNRRNPGTTADLITAGLFVELRRGRIPLNATVNTGIT